MLGRVCQVKNSQLNCGTEMETCPPAVAAGCMLIEIDRGSTAYSSLVPKFSHLLPPRSPCIDSQHIWFHSRDRLAAQLYFQLVCIFGDDSSSCHELSDIFTTLWPLTLSAEVSCVYWCLYLVLWSLLESLVMSSHVNLTISLGTLLLWKMSVKALKCCIRGHWICVTHLLSVHVS